jgi:hypothetical protein
MEITVQSREHEDHEEAVVDRRVLLRRGGAVLAGTAGLAAVGAANAGSASADPGQPVIQGADNNALSTRTTLTSSNATGTLSLSNTGGGAPINIAHQDTVDTVRGGDFYNVVGNLFFGHDLDFPGFVYTDLVANQLVPINPARVLDTRTSAGRARIINPSGNIDSQGRLIGGRSIQIDLADFVFFGIAMYGNLTVTAPVAAGFATLYPIDPRPATSTVNYVTNQTVANFAVCGIGFTETILDLVSIFSSRTTHVILDATAFSVGHPAQVSGASTPSLSPAPSSEATAKLKSRQERAAAKLAELRGLQ